VAGSVYSSLRTTHDSASSIHPSRRTGLDFDDIVSVLRRRTRNSVSKHWYSKLKKIHGDPEIEAGPYIPHPQLILSTIGAFCDNVHGS
jgi:hypothetical protein